MGDESRLIIHIRWCAFQIHTTVIGTYAEDDASILVVVIVAVEDINF